MSTYKRDQFLYEGKAKRLYAVSGHSDLLWIEYKDDLTAFNAQKKGSFKGKGELNFAISQLIFDRLNHAGVASHVRGVVSANEMVVEKLTMFPIEVVVRNWVAGSLAQKFGIAEGTQLERPLIEFYYKNDALNDPFMSDDHVLMLNLATLSEIESLKTLARKINAELSRMFLKAHIRLVDFKIELGKTASGEIQLGDEISPDSCRLWDEKTLEKLDKDRFRRDLGKVEESYREVYRRLQMESK